MIGLFLDVFLGKRMPTPDHLPPGAVPSGVTLRTGDLVPKLGTLLGRMRGTHAAAVTLGRTIIVRSGVQLTADLLAHELTHVRQWERDPLFPVRYALATLRHGYDNNPYEVEARTFASATSDKTPNLKST